MENKLSQMDISHLRKIYEQIEKGVDVNHVDLKFWKENSLKYFEHLQNQKLDSELQIYSKKEKLTKDSKKDFMEIKSDKVEYSGGNYPAPYTPVKRRSFVDVIEKVDGYNRIQEVEKGIKEKLVKEVERSLEKDVDEEYTKLSSTIMGRLKKNKGIKEKLVKEKEEFEYALSEENKEVKDGYSLKLFPVKPLKDSVKPLEKLSLVEGIPGGDYKIPPLMEIEKTEAPPIVMSYLNFKNGEKLSRKQYKQFEKKLVSGRAYAEDLVNSYLSGEVDSKQYHKLKSKIWNTARGENLANLFGDIDGLKEFEKKGIDYELSLENSWLQKRYLKNKKKQIDNSDLEKIVQKDWRNVAKGALVAGALLAATCFGVNELNQVYDGRKTNEEIIREIYSTTEAVEQTGVAVDSLDNTLNSAEIRQKIAGINTERGGENLVSHKWGDLDSYCLIQYFDANHPDVDHWAAVKAFEKDNPGVNPNVLRDDREYNFRGNYSNVDCFDNVVERDNYAISVDNRNPSSAEESAAEITWVESTCPSLESQESAEITINNVVSGDVYTVAVADGNNNVLGTRRILVHDYNQGVISLNFEGVDYSNVLLFNGPSVVNTGNLEFGIGSESYRGSHKVSDNGQTEIDASGDAVVQGDVEQTYVPVETVEEGTIIVKTGLEEILNYPTNVSIPTNVDLNSGSGEETEIVGSNSGGGSGGLGGIPQIEGVSSSDIEQVHTEAEIIPVATREYSINGIINDAVSVTIPVMGEYTVYITDANGNTVGVYETNRLVGRDLPYNFAIENFELYGIQIGDLSNGTYSAHLGNALKFDPITRQYTSDEITNSLEFIVESSDSTYVEEEKLEEEKGFDDKGLYGRIIEGHNSGKRFSTIKKEISKEYKGIGDKTLVSTVDDNVRNDGDAYSERFDRDYAKVSGLMDEIISMYENSVSYVGIKEHCKRHGMGISDSTIYRVGSGKYDSFLA